MKNSDNENKTSRAEVEGLQKTSEPEGIKRCTRCGNERKTMPIFMVRPGAHTWPMPAPPNFESAVPPTVERSCGDCLTDHEIMRALSPAVEFVLSALVKNVRPDVPGILVALETARTFFMTRNNNPDGSNRPAALKALGLEPSEG